MCQQCQGFDDEDEAALAASFVLRRDKTGPLAKPKTVRLPAVPSKDQMHA
jgi:hypothetical protein